MSTLDIAKQYYEYFNAKNWNGMVSMVSDNVIHEPNQGDTRNGIEQFKDFMKMMDESYEETLTNLDFFVNESNTKVACQFTVNGIYKKGEEGLPEAKNQTYILPAASFLEISNGKITKISTHYNLPLWISLVS